MLNIIQLENTIKLLKRGKFELEGEEIVAFYNCMNYLVKLIEESKKPPIQLAKPEEPVKLKKAKKEK